MTTRTLTAIDADLQRYTEDLPKLITPSAIKAIKHHLDRLLDERNNVTKENR